MERIIKYILFRQRGTETRWATIHSLRNESESRDRQPEWKQQVVDTSGK